MHPTAPKRPPDIKPRYFVCRPYQTLGQPSESPQRTTRVFAPFAAFVDCRCCAHRLESHEEGSEETTANSEGLVEDHSGVGGGGRGGAGGGGVGTAGLGGGGGSGGLGRHGLHGGGGASGVGGGNRASDSSGDDSSAGSGAGRLGGRLGGGAAGAAAGAAGALLSSLGDLEGLGLGEDAGVLGVVGDEVELVAAASGSGGKVGQGVLVVRSLDLLVDDVGRVNVVLVDQLEGEGRGIGVDRGPGDGDILGEVNLLVLGRASDQDGCKNELVSFVLSVAGFEPVSGACGIPIPRR